MCVPKVILQTNMIKIWRDPILRTYIFHTAWSYTAYTLVWKELGLALYINLYSGGNIHRMLSGGHEWAVRWSSDHQRITKLWIDTAIVMCISLSSLHACNCYQVGLSVPRMSMLVLTACLCVHSLACHTCTLFCWTDVPLKPWKRVLLTSALCEQPGLSTQLLAIIE